MASIVEGIAAQELQALLAPEAGFNLTGIEEAAALYAGLEGQLPTKPADLQPYCFSWPRIPGDPEGRLVQLADTSAGLAPQQTWTFESGGAGRMDLAIQSGEFIATVPYFVPLTAGGPMAQLYVSRPLPWRRSLPGEPAAPRLSSVPSIAASADSPARNEQLFDYLSRTAHPHDVRVQAAQRAVSRLIQEAAKRSATLPATLDQAEFHGVASMIQVTRVSPDQADLIVEFDGVQAYRYTFKLESGEVGQVVSYYFAVHPMDAANVYAPEGRVNDPNVVWQPFAALALEAPLTAWPSEATA